MQVETSRDARTAALAGTRQMIADDQFSVLVAALVECRAVPREIMAGALERLADGLIAKARGAMETDFQLFPTELFDRARSLGAMAGALRTGRGGCFSGLAQ